MKAYRTSGLLHTPIKTNGKFVLYELSDKDLIKGYTLTHDQRFIKSFYCKESGVLATLNAKRLNPPQALAEYLKHKL